MLLQNFLTLSWLIVDIQAKYIVDEVNDKTGKLMDVRSWKQEFVEDLPEQKNGCVFPLFSIFIVPLLKIVS